jgi:hypothetical protein
MPSYMGAMRFRLRRVGKIAGEIDARLSSDTAILPTLQLITVA